MRTAREIVQRDHARKKIECEIERLEDRKKYILNKRVSERGFEEQKFLDGVDETIQKFIRELNEL